MTSNPTFLPIRLTGGIGDVIMDGEVARILSERYQSMIYTPHLEAFKYFYPDLKASWGIPDYTWQLEIGPVARFVKDDEFSGFLLKKHEDLFLGQRELFRKNPPLKEFVKAHPHSDHLLCQYACNLGLDRRSISLHTLGVPDGPRSTPVRRNAPENYFTVHDGYDTQNIKDIEGRSTKQWTLHQWDELIQTIRKNFPGIKIIQLGSRTGREIIGVDECLINQTSIIEAFDILSKSRLHIDGDSGLVHAATRLGVPCVVMFGPTPDYFYGYRQNKNIRSISPCEHACYWAKPDWMLKCVKGFDSPKCMDQISPARVMSALYNKVL